MLLGRYYSQVSKKGRVSLPSKFRHEIGNNIIIARWYENCLVIVGLLGWKDFLSRLTRKDEIVVRPIRGVERHIFSTAFEVETDSQGRFVIPPHLRNFAHIDKEIVFVGLGDRVELWSQETWQKEEKEVEKSAEEMLESIANFTRHKK